LLDSKKYRPPLGLGVPRSLFNPDQFEEQDLYFVTLSDIGRDEENGQV